MHKLDFQPLNRQFGGDNFAYLQGSLKQGKPSKYCMKVTFAYTRQVGMISAIGVFQVEYDLGITKMLQVLSPNANLDLFS